MTDNKSRPIVIMGGGIKQNLEKALKDYIDFRLYGKTKDGVTIYDLLMIGDSGEDQICDINSYNPKKKDI